MKNYGFMPTEILIPHGIDMSKWSCVACDQYTSESEYWESVENYVGNSPSTLRLMLPEIYLDDVEKRESEIAENIKKYLQSGIFSTIEDSFIFVERTLANGNIRYGLIGAIDLEIYDYLKGTVSLCRPTEATVVERLPARVNVRKKAAIEMPHIMMLIDDKADSVILPYSKITDKLELLYDFELMQNSGHIKGYRIDKQHAGIALKAIEGLYDNCKEQNPLLYAMGDGNHSLAAAKKYYEELKSKYGESAKELPARYALVELVNLYDKSLEFEAIHRVLFNVDVKKFMDSFKNHCGLVKGKQSGQNFQIVFEGQAIDYTFTKPDSILTIANIQNFIDAYAKSDVCKTDYIHGRDTVIKLCNQKDRLGFIIPSINKDSFFEVIKRDGILPRKTFSMGNACDKRFYLECRKIID